MSASVWTHVWRPPGLRTTRWTISRSTPMASAAIRRGISASSVAWSSTYRRSKAEGSYETPDSVTNHQRPLAVTLPIDWPVQCCNFGHDPVDRPGTYWREKDWE